MTRREEWKRVLDAETERWSAKSCDQLVDELCELRSYEILFDSKKYQVEVELLENTNEYVRVVLAVDDGSLPWSVAPATVTFIRQKTEPILNCK
jgi:hypothetical protein